MKVIPGDILDARMRALVKAMNELPGIDTFSSCGGHANPEDGQRPEGEFTVSFDVDPLRGGWRSLQLITFAISEGDDSPNLNLSVWLGGDSPSTMAFELDGSSGADPNELAATIFEVGAELYDSDDNDLEDDDDDADEEDSDDDPDEDE